MRRRAKRLKDLGQRGLGFESVPVDGERRKAALSGEFFLPDDPRDLFVGSQRLDEYVRGSGLEWVIRLRSFLEEVDYSALLPAYRATGRRAVSPRAMVGLIVYGILQR